MQGSNVSNSVYRSFSDAGADIVNIFSSMPATILNDLFDNGRYFLHLEVVDSYNRNRVIQYNTDFLVLHEFTLYNANGSPVSKDHIRVDKLYNHIVKPHYKALKYEICKYQKVKFDTGGLKKYKKLHFGLIDDFLQRYNLVSTSTVDDYYIEYFKRNLDDVIKIARTVGIDLDALLRRFALHDKSYRLDTINIGNDSLLDMLKTIDSDRSIYNAATNELNAVFRKIGNDILNYAISGFYRFVDAHETVNNIDTAYNAAIANGMLDWNIHTINEIGLHNMIVPLEGIVIQDTPTIKITGYYPILNNLVNSVKTK